MVDRVPAVMVPRRSVVRHEVMFFDDHGRWSNDRLIQRRRGPGDLLHARRRLLHRSNDLLAHTLLVQ